MDKVAGIPVTYDETKVSSYTLPDPLVLQNAKKVKNANAWMSKRRPEILRFFQDFQLETRLVIKNPIEPSDP